ncbi:Hypothetical protein GLP15_3893 [Giardia lamblia P15]|uniref:SANT domain-containing protein n=1 Tax=Giardia intestinalis (strain P15) TaxID=658858 RepID=E1F0L2_GIAIA|nr:Hypothetical protein GLP15_3893 [Giardia lamblia P15]
MSTCQLHDNTSSIDQQACILPQTVLAPPFGFSTNPNGGLSPLYPLFPVEASSQATVPAWGMAVPSFQPMLSFPQAATLDEMNAPTSVSALTSAPIPVPVQPFRQSVIDAASSDIAVKGAMLSEDCTDNGNGSANKTGCITSRPSRLEMKKKDQSASTTDVAMLSGSRTKQPVKRAPRRVWSDEEHSAYLRFVRYKAVNGRIDERILATIPNRTLVQIKQYNYKYNIYRDNGLDVVDDAFTRNPQVLSDFSNFINTIVSKYVINSKPKMGAFLGLYDSIAFQWNLYHSLRILGSSSSVSASASQHDSGTIPPFSSDTLRNICLGMIELIQKPVFRNSSLQIFELVRFLTTLRRYINGAAHIQAFKHFIKFLSLLTDGLDLTRCNDKLTSRDLQNLFSLCEEPCTADDALYIATTVVPSVYISFQCTPGADPGALRAITNLESCHLHIPHIPSSVYQMLCSVLSQICHELEPRTCLYLSTTFLVYLQILSGSVEEIIYEIYKYGSPRCTTKAVSEQSTLILCIISYILCFAIVQYEENEVT